MEKEQEDLAGVSNRAWENDPLELNGRKGGETNGHF